jgi:hypothetical protein
LTTAVNAAADAMAAVVTRLCCSRDVRPRDAGAIFSRYAKVLAQRSPLRDQLRRDRGVVRSRERSGYVRDGRP